jgi:cytochrome c oxidase cbb3-type subunit 2
MASGGKAVHERWAFIFFLAGIGFFVIGTFIQAVLPIIVLGGTSKMKTKYQVVAEGFYKRQFPEILQLLAMYPNLWKKYYNVPDQYFYTAPPAVQKQIIKGVAQAISDGRWIYMAEGCWQCHSQFVRPVANEPAYYGHVSVPSEYDNTLFLPHLFGTERKGPDLIREAGKKGVEWHLAHFVNPQYTVPGSIMPRFAKFVDLKDGKPVLTPVNPNDAYASLNPEPTKYGLAVITYLEWLGSWYRPQYFTEWRKEVAEERQNLKAMQAAMSVGSTSNSSSNASNSNNSSSSSSSNSANSNANKTASASGVSQ